MSKKIGIIGGVGPSATADLFRLIIANTPAKKDQEHLRIFIDNHPQIPDRTAALLNNGPSCEPALQESIDILQKAGAELLVCPCNTAHVFLRQMKGSMQIPFIDMIEETMKVLKEKNITVAGLLSTAGTAKTGIYQQTAEKMGITIYVPSDENIAKEMEAIYGAEGIKAGSQFEKSQKNKQLFLEIIEELKLKGAQAIIMGCTEIPLCLEKSDTDMPLINPTEILAKAAVQSAIL